MTKKDYTARTEFDLWLEKCPMYRNGRYAKKSIGIIHKLIYGFVYRVTVKRLNIVTLWTTED